MRGHAGDVRPILRASTPHVSREQQDKEETRNDVHNAPKYVRMKNAGGQQAHTMGSVSTMTDSWTTGPLNRGHRAR